MALDPSTTELATQSANLKSLELLFNYTTFHIGAYLTLTSAFVAIASLKKGEEFALPLRRCCVVVAVLAFMVAGLAGGVIASTITQCYGTDASLPMRCASTHDFLAMQMGPWNGCVFSTSGRRWTYIEHTSFWIGILFALGSIVLAPKAKVAAEPKPPLPVMVQGSVRIDKDAV